MCGNVLFSDAIGENSTLEKSKKKRKWPIIVIIVCLLCVISAVLSTVHLNSNSNKDPVEVTKNFVKAAK